MAQQPNYYTTMAIAKLFEDDAMRNEFMAVYGQDSAAAQAFLVQRLGMPADMAQAIVSKTGDELSLFVGRNVCSYLW